MTREDRIKEAVGRFLGWKLPRDFCPDGGVSFKPFGTHDTHSWPIGTNILTAEQARQMFEYCLPDETPPQKG